MSLFHFISYTIGIYIFPQVRGVLRGRGTEAEGDAPTLSQGMGVPVPSDDGSFRYDPPQIN